MEIFITRLRKKVDSGFDTPLIHTIRAVGYTLCAPLAAQEAADAGE